MERCHKFSKCKDKQPLEFDVYLINEKKIIELDGIQHFRVIDKWGGAEQFLIGRHHDEIKDNFCSDNNIPLLRIPYIYDADDDKDEIEAIIKDFIKNGTIPQKIVDFYKSGNRNSYIELLSKTNS